MKNYANIFYLILLILFQRKSTKKCVECQNNCINCIDTDIRKCNDEICNKGKNICIEAFSVLIVIISAGNNRNNY